MIKIEINDADVTAAFARLSAALTNLSPAMAETAELLRISTRDRIQAGTSPDGTPFAARSPTTLAAYAARKQTSGGILVMTGTLQRQISVDSGSDFAEVGSDREYAAVMQFGAAQGEFGAAIGRTKPSAKRPKSQDYFVTLPWGNIPARPFIGLSDSDRSGIIEILEEWLARSTGTAN